MFCSLFMFCEGDVPPDKAIFDMSCVLEGLFIW